MNSTSYRTALILLIVTVAACGRAKNENQIVGTLERDRIEVAVEFSEPIARILVTEGDVVAAGQTLIEQDTAVLAAEISRAQSRIAEVTARLDELKRGSRREVITAAKARVSGVDARIAGIQRDFERARKLVASDAAPRAELDAWRQKLDEANAARAEARAAFEQAVNGNTRETIRAAEAVVAEADSALSELIARGDRLVVRAPAAGRIDALPFEVGERPPVGHAVAVLLANSAPYARVYVPEPIRVNVTPGLGAEVHIDGMEKPFDGVVRIISHEAAFTPYFALTEHDRGRLSYVAEITLTSPDAASLPTGIPCQATFTFEQTGSQSRNSQ